MDERNSGCPVGLGFRDWILRGAEKYEKYEEYKKTNRKAGETVIAARGNGVLA
jgi:hypothetical protein